MTRLATPRFGLDAAGPIPIGAQKAIGSTFNVRYLSRYRWKVLLVGEYAKLKAAGIDLAIVFEDDAVPRQGFDAGQDDAQFCKEQGIARGLPWPFPCFWAYDTATSGNVSPWESYAEGFASVFSKSGSGPYGDYYICKHFGDRGYMTWQCTAAWGWNGGKSYDTQNFYPADIYQYSNGHYVGGADCDYDRCFDDRIFVGHSEPTPPTLPEHAMITFMKNASSRDEYGLALESGEVIHCWKEPDGAWHPDWDSLGFPGSPTNPIVGITSGVNAADHDEYGVKLKDGSMKHLWKVLDPDSKLEVWNRRPDGGFAWEVLSR